MKIAIMNVGFAMLFFLIMFFVNRHSIKSALGVFYSTIRKLEDFEVNKAEVLTLETAEVDEVRKLNAVFEKMSKQTVQKRKEIFRPWKRKMVKWLKLLNFAD
jgi:uncharacterized protein YoxC